MTAIGCKKNLYSWNRKSVKMFTRDSEVIAIDKITDVRHQRNLDGVDSILIMKFGRLFLHDLSDQSKM